MKRILFLASLLAVLLENPPSRAANLDSPRGLFLEANSGYQKGDYAAAERTYKNLIAAGVEDGVVYYNLGNACFKQKKLGEAIYYWEKARRKLPGDADIRENLELANLLVVDRIESPVDPLPVRIIDRIVHFFTIVQESWLALFFFFLASGCLGMYLLARRPGMALTGLIGSMIAGIFIVFFAGSIAWKNYESQFRRQAVIVEQKIDLRSGPGTENITVFTIHEGVLVRVREQAGDWYQVSLPNGWSGWLPENAIRIL